MSWQDGELRHRKRKKSKRKALAVEVGTWKGTSAAHIVAEGALRKGYKDYYASTHDSAPRSIYSTRTNGRGVRRCAKYSKFVLSKSRVLQPRIVLG